MIIAETNGPTDKTQTQSPLTCFAMIGLDVGSQTDIVPPNTLVGESNKKKLMVYGQLFY